MVSNFESFALLSTYIYDENLAFGNGANLDRITSSTVSSELKKKYSMIQGLSVVDYGDNVIGMKLDDGGQFEQNYTIRYEKFCRELCNVNQKNFHASFSSRMFRIVPPCGKISFEKLGDGSIEYLVFPVFEIILSADGLAFKRNVTFECMLLPSSLTGNAEQDLNLQEEILTQPYSAKLFILEDSPLLNFYKVLRSREGFNAGEKREGISLEMLLDISRTVAEDLLQPSKNIEMKGEIFRFVKLNTSYDDEKWLDFRRKFTGKKESLISTWVDQDKRLIDHVLNVSKASEFGYEEANESEVLFQYEVSAEKFYISRSLFFYVNQSKTLMELGPELSVDFEDVVSGPFTLNRFVSYEGMFYYILGMLVNISILSSILLYYFDKVSISEKLRHQDIGAIENELVLDYDEYYDFVLKNSGYRNVIARIREMSFLNSDFIKLRDRIKTLKENENRRHDTGVSKSLSILTIAVVVVSFLDTIATLFGGIQRVLSLSILVVFIAFVVYYVLYKNRS